MPLAAVLLNQALCSSKLAHRHIFVWPTALKNWNFKNIDFYVKKLFFTKFSGVRAMFISAANSPCVASKVVVDSPLHKSEWANSEVCTMESSIPGRCHAMQCRVRSLTHKGTSKSSQSRKMELRVAKVKMITPRIWKKSWTHDHRDVVDAGRSDF